MHKLTSAALLAFGAILAGCNNKTDAVSVPPLQASGPPTGTMGVTVPASSPASDPSLPSAARVLSSPASSASAP